MKPRTAAIAFIAPLAVFFAVGALVPYEAIAENDVDGSNSVIIPVRYLTVVAAKAVLMTIVVGVCWRVYAKSFPFRIDFWGPTIGVVGGLLWILCCSLGLEVKLMNLLSFPEELLGARAGVDPGELYPDSSQRALFLIARFALLVMAVPIAEELFLRGFFLRFIEAREWQDLPLAEIGTGGLVAATVYGMLTHPSEFVAAAVWFSLVTLLMVKTGKFWNCVAAHAITNLMLGIYIMNTGNWHLW